MRLIDADALQSEYMRYHDGKRIVLVDVAPTIEERKTGNWKILRDRSSGQEFSCCNRCDHYYSANASDWNFCPNCGADMRGEQDERSD